MYVVSPFIYHLGPRVIALITLAGIAFAALLLLGYAVTLWTGIEVPRLDGPELAPFRWAPPASLA